MLTIWKSILCVLISALSIPVCCAQTDFHDIIDSTISIERDVRLDSLVMRHVRVNKQRDGLSGYRLQLFSGSGTEARQQANKLRAEFMDHYPDIPAYLIYQSPNFKVRVGDYRTELEAIHLQRELEYQYSGGFVVKDEIKFPKLGIEQEKDEEDGESEFLEGLELPKE